MPPTRKYLIVNADDFGQSPGVNRGVARAHERGIVTSASLMVRWPAAVEAAAYGQEHPELSLGLHVDLGEWAYRDGDWRPVYRVIANRDGAKVAEEVARQLDAFRRLTGRTPTHLDSHQHVHHDEPLGSVLLRIADELGIPLRERSPRVRYLGGFYGQTPTGAPLRGAVTVHTLARMLAALPPGVTELGCHPGEGDDLDSMYRRERAREVRVLCDPRIRAAVAEAGIALCSFADLANRADRVD
jgi:predicted glycoside hydrolase/deacetylase ChbG (UPF0249 family)